MDKVRELVGTPFMYGGRDTRALDCYGLVMLAHQYRGVTLPDYASPSDQALIAAMMGSQLPLWEEAPPGTGTVALLRIGRLASHCGYMLDSDHMIHAWESSGGVSIQRIDVWKHRLMGFYKYVG